jgi:hypothetical protein
MIATTFFCSPNLYLFFFASLINIHTNLRFIVKQQQIFLFYLFRFSLFFRMFYISFIYKVFPEFIYMSNFWSLSSREFPVMSYKRGSDSQWLCSYEYFQPKNIFCHNSTVFTMKFLHNKVKFSLVKVTLSL